MQRTLCLLHTTRKHKMNNERDLAHESDMNALRNEQLAADCGDEPFHWDDRVSGDDDWEDWDNDEDDPYAHAHSNYHEQNPE